MEVVQRGPEHDGRRAPQERRHGRDPAVGAVLTREEVEQGRGRGERERLHDEDARRADPERPERCEQRDPGLDVVAEQRAEVDRC